VANNAVAAWFDGAEVAGRRAAIPCRWAPGRATDRPSDGVAMTRRRPARGLAGRRAAIGSVIAVALSLAAACKPRRGHDEPVALRGDAGPRTPPRDPPGDAGLDAPSPWAPLAGFPAIAPVRVIGLPARPDVPRFNVGGPVIAGDVAIVSSSQFGFAAVDWRRGALAWTKPAGLHVAPPIARGDTAILIGDCINPPDVSDTLLGCLRVVTAAGADQSYAAIHGGARVAAFAATPGPQDVWFDGERAVRWRRGDQAVSVDLITGVAHPAAAEAEPVHVVYAGHAWDITRTEQRIVAREHGKLAWQTARPYTSLLGAVYLAELAPAVRVTSIGALGLPEMVLLDIDATGSLHGQVGFPVPALSTLGYAIDGVGNTAIAVRMDSSLRHDYIAGYAANALLMYVYRLPEIPRAEPVGVAVAPDGVLVFHDGDTFTVLPELSSPPTAPGAPRPSSQNPPP